MFLLTYIFLKSVCPLLPCTVLVIFQIALPFVFLKAISLLCSSPKEDNKADLGLKFLMLDYELLLHWIHASWFVGLYVRLWTTSPLNTCLVVCRCICIVTFMEHSARTPERDFLRSCLKFFFLLREIHKIS